jgi:tetratricopeptide (TPR) repeat protein
MEKTLTASRLRRYVGGLAALSVAPPGAVERPAAEASTLRLPSTPEAPALPEPREPGTTAQTLAQAAELIGREDWARAQRLLEDATRRNPDKEIASYLEEVRAVRRTRRRLARWPRDAALRTDLGRLYFGLELGDQAAMELRRAIELEPTSAEAHFYLALEHLFREEEAISREHLARAAALRPDVPSYETLFNLLWQSAAD